MLSARRRNSVMTSGAGERARLSARCPTAKRKALLSHVALPLSPLHLRGGCLGLEPALGHRWVFVSSTYVRGD